MSYVLIIGARSDIAKATAECMQSMDGYDLYLAARNANELNNFFNDIYISTQRTVKTVELDILDYNSHQSFYDQIEEKPFIGRGLCSRLLRRTTKMSD